MEIAAWLIAIVCIVAYFANRQFMYFPDPTRVAPENVGLDDLEEIELRTADGVTLVAWHAPAMEGKRTILYFHGNGANAANRAPRIERMHRDGFGVFYLNNRGYGGSGGRPTEENNVADAITAYDYLMRLGVSSEKIVAYASRSAQARRLGLRQRRPSLQLCWNRHSPQQLMSLGPRISGCPSAC